MFDEGQYLTYKEYQKLGGSLEQTPFNLLEFESRKRIDLKTQRRLVELADDVPNEVKLCVFNLINVIDSYLKTTNTQASNIASENIDGYSVSYITPTQIKDVVESIQEEIDDNIVSDLFGLEVDGEHVLYCGL